MKRLLALSVVAVVIAGCGGSGGRTDTVPTGPDAQMRSRVQGATVIALRLADRDGDVSLGLQRKPSEIPLVSSPNWSDLVYDESRTLWSRYLIYWESPEDPSGIGSIQRNTVDYEYFGDELMTESSGQCKKVTEQIESQLVETTHVTEAITRGSLAGYQYTNHVETSMSTMESTREVTAKHANWGEMTTTGSLTQYTMSWKKDGKTDLYVVNEDEGTFHITLSDGTVLHFDDETGTAVNASGQTVGTVTWSGNAGSIRWSNGETTSFTVWPS